MDGYLAEPVQVLGQGLIRALSELEEHLMQGLIRYRPCGAPFRRKEAATAHTGLTPSRYSAKTSSREARSSTCGSLGAPLLEAYISSPRSRRFSSVRAGALLASSLVSDVSSRDVLEIHCRRYAAGWKLT